MTSLSYCFGTIFREMPTERKGSIVCTQTVHRTGRSVNWFDTKFLALLDRHFGGHSLRAGGTTYFASLGLGPF